MNDYYSPVGLIDFAPMVILDWRAQVGAKIFDPSKIEFAWK